MQRLSSVIVPSYEANLSSLVVNRTKEAWLLPAPISNPGCTNDDALSPRSADTIGGRFGIPILGLFRE